MYRPKSLALWLTQIVIAVASLSSAIASPICAEIFAPAAEPTIAHTQQDESSFLNALEAVRNGEANPMLFAAGELRQSAERIENVTRYLREQKALTVSLENATAKRLGEKLDTYQRSIEALEKASKERMGRWGRLLGWAKRGGRSLAKVAQAANLSRAEAEQLAAELERENKLYEDVDSELTQGIKALEAEMNHFDQLIEILFAEVQSTPNHKWRNAINDQVLPLFQKEAGNLRTLLALSDGTRQAIGQRVFMNSAAIQQVRHIRDGALPTLLTTGDSKLRDALDVNRAAAGDANPFCIKADLCTGQKALYVYEFTRNQRYDLYEVTVEGVLENGMYVVNKGKRFGNERITVKREDLALTTKGLPHQNWKIGDEVFSIRMTHYAPDRKTFEGRRVDSKEFVAHLNNNPGQQYTVQGRPGRIIGILPDGRFVLDHGVEGGVLTADYFLPAKGTFEGFAVGEEVVTGTYYWEKSTIHSFDRDTGTLISASGRGTRFYKPEELIKLSGTVAGFSVGDTVTDTLGNKLYVIGIIPAANKVVVSKDKRRSDWVIWEPKIVPTTEIRHR